MTDRPEQVDPDATVRATAQALLELTAAVVEQLHPHRRGGAPVGLDDSLERDLGFDSLGRVELLFRMEETFGVSLPDSLLAAAETPRDLLRAVAGAEGGVRRARTAEIERISLATGQGDPSGAETLVEVLERQVAADPERLYVSFLAEGEQTDPMSYGQLAAEAERVAAGLQAFGLQPGQAVAIMLPTGREYFYSFYGALLAGGIPTPIYPPFRASQMEEHLRRHTAILANCLAPVLITLPEAHSVANWLSGQVESLRWVATVAEVQAGGGRFARPAAGGGDIALLQYTSGSTGDPKGVVLTHRNLLANIRAMGRAIQADGSDVFVSWLPLYHDMGLIGACLATMYYAVPVVLMSPLTFMARPEKWLWAIHRFRGTLSGGVNFAYELCLSKIRERSLEGLDLTSWRFAFNGAEPISPETLLGFQQRFAPYGFDAKAMAPVYGLAESSVGLAFPALGRGPLLDRVGRDLFLREGRALPAGQGAADALRFVACGHPLPGHQIRIVDGRGHEVGERQSGRLQFMGPSATSGYFRNAEATRGLFEGDWLDSGDIAYVAGGEVYLTGRVKDVIIRAGRNLHPYELEDAVGGLAGIRKGNVAVFGSARGGDGTERLVVVAETRLRDPEQRRELERRIEEQSMLLVGSPPDDVVLAPAHSVLKTSSGKIRRAAVRELFERGAFGGSAAGRWWVARVALGGAAARLRLLRRRVVEWSYGCWAYAVIGGVGLVAWPLIAIMPRPRWAWRVARRAARLVLALARIPVHVQGLEHLPRDRPFVMAANHSSYLDPLVLAAVIPIDMTYVAKGELASSFISRIFLRRLDSELVERFESQKGAHDAERVAGRLARGNSLMYFPEGTFRRAPGLAPFHMGAFTAAAPAGAPLVPVSLRGTRTLLREGEWLPRRTAVAVRISPPEWPGGSDWNAALKLRDACRGALLRHGGEPDLAAEG